MDRWEEIERLPIVGVMGSGTRPYRERTEVLGKWLAKKNVHLLTGGGGGVMTSVSRSFTHVPDRLGRVMGIIPGTVTESGYKPLRGYPNPWVEIPVFTHLPLSGTSGSEQMSRNHINILTSDVIVALPGGYGTSSEVRLALYYQKPVVAYLHNRHEIPDLSEAVTVIKDLEVLKTFIRSTIEKIKRSQKPMRLPQTPSF
jgi:uncharacterized protein (TIGR00725 family)